MSLCEACSAGLAFFPLQETAALSEVLVRAGGWHGCSTPGSRPRSQPRTPVLPVLAGMMRRYRIDVLTMQGYMKLALGGVLAEDAAYLSATAEE